MPPSATAPTPPADAAHVLVRLLWLLWVAFVVYGSLVPLQFQPLPWDEAIARFAQLPMLRIGVQGRADWVANGVLYVPVGFLSAALLARRGRRPGWVVGLAALGFGLALAVALEFAQLHFPPRTTSLNDLLAEGLGTALGVVLAWQGKTWLPNLARILRGHWQDLGPVLAPVGAVVVLLLGLFPFDFLVSASEFAAKASGPHWGWWTAPAFVEQSLILQGAKLLAEAAILVPLGALWARSAAPVSVELRAPAPLGRAFALGAGLGVLVEVGQWCTASGVSQGVSTLTRGSGWMLGAWLWNRRATWGVTEWRAAIRRWWWPLVVVHFVLAVVLGGWFDGPWRTPAEAATRLRSGELRLMPFYYHYFSSESAALFRLLAVSLLYMPIALWCWARDGSWRQAALAGAMAATVVEAGRLLPINEFPDATNILVAAATAAVVRHLLGHFFAPTAAPLKPENSPASPSATSEAISKGGAAWSLLPAAVIASIWLTNFPVAQFALGVMLSLAAALVWHRPAWAVTLAMAALPTLNLGVWSGREYVDEFDMTLFVVFTTALLRLRQAPRVPSALQTDWKLNGILAFTAASLAASTLMGWRPWDMTALADPADTISPWHALRVAKGWVWALCLYAVAWRLQAANHPTTRFLAMGMLIGLVALLAGVFWERMTFVGLWNFASAYRVAGLLLAMKTGGAYLDAGLIAALPFALIGAIKAPSWWQRGLCASIALAATYAVAVTFTRTTYLALLVVCGLLTVFQLRPWPRGLPMVAAAGTLVLMAIVAYPIVTGPFAKSRLATVESDFSTRRQHLQQSLALSEESPITTLFGHGLSRFPAYMHWARAAAASGQSPMAIHRFVHADGISQLQLGAGLALYVDQLVHVQPRQRVEILVRARAAPSAGRLGIGLCHKWMLSSEDCASAGLAVPAGPNWHVLRTSVPTGVLGADPGLLTPTVRVTFYNAGSTRIDIDQISMRDASGRELLHNGSFDAGGDHWTYTSDDHLAWHIKNLPVHVWFEMGLAGALAFGALLGLALWRAGAAALAGNHGAQALVASLVGLIVVGAFDSVVDEPRFLFLWLALCVMCAMQRPPTTQSVVPRLEIAHP